MSLIQKNQWILLGLIASLCQAMAIICNKMGACYVESVLVGVLETGVTLVMLFSVCIYSKKSFSPSLLSREALPYIVVSGLFAAISYVSYYVIMNYATVSKAASLDQFSLVFVFLLAMLFLGEKFTWKSALGSILLLIGMGFMVLHH